MFLSFLKTLLWGEFVAKQWKSVKTGGRKPGTDASEVRSNGFCRMMFNSVFTTPRIHPVKLITIVKDFSSSGMGEKKELRT